MRSSLSKCCKTPPSVHLASVVVLSLLLSGWSGCSAFVGFTSCPGPVPQVQMTSLEPDTIPHDTTSVLLTVNGSGFTPHSRVAWNGNTLETTFKNSRQLQATITQETFEFFGGSPGNAVQVSVQPQGSGSGSGCPSNWNSEVLVLTIK
jgi:hypothetical protein